MFAAEAAYNSFVVDVSEASTNPSKNSLEY